MSVIELEPCPFCGAHGAFVRDDCPTMWVECRFCGAHGPFGCGELRAAEAWNARADDILQRADVTRGQVSCDAVPIAGRRAGRP